MSQEDTLVEAPESVRNDRFVEVNYDDAIPNNVDLSSDRQLLRALESWHPNYIDWWKDMGPDGFQNAEVYLRTAVGVDPAGWAKFGYVKMPDYRWGILLAAMVYLLVKYFGKDGGEEAQALLERRSGQQDNPRILGAFNERTPDWLSFFMFTYFTDRDGKMQLAALAESGFDPLSRSCRFMLTEEAHHLFVGETGVGRSIEATCAAMNKAGITDPFDSERIRALGVVDLPLLQRKANFHMSVTRDLFGSEISSNAADAFSAGLKGRFNEAKLTGDDHQLQDATYKVQRVVDGELVWEDVPALRAINSRLLDDYIADCQGGIDRWNKAIEKAGIHFRFTQPHKGFNRRIGEFAGHAISPAGELLGAESWAALKDEWLPNGDDMAFIHSLMKPCHRAGEYASWIAPPRMGINQQPVDYEYVKID